MKLNERLYEELGNLPYVEPAPGEDYVPVPSTPIETQNVNGHSVEIYYMNEYKDVLEEFTKQGKFAVWSSKDGKNYRLAVEKDYYEKLNELYTVDVNKEWLGFWDKCELMQKSFSRKIVIPITIVVIILFLFITSWNNIFKNAQMSDTVNMIFMFGIPVIYLIGMLFVRKTIINNITKEQQNALQKIKEFFGESKYEKLLKEQRTYIDDYFDAHQSDDENLDENSTDETKEENEIVETTNVTKEEENSEEEILDSEVVEEKTTDVEEKEDIEIKEE